MKGYYVTVIRDKQKGWLYGPAFSHEEALAMVESVRQIACKVDPWCDFDAFGTSSIETERELPRGKLNDYV